MFKAPRGTADILPEDQAYWSHINSKAVAAARLYGYGRIDTPAFEDAGLFARSVGEGTDIVNKEMYIFKDRSDNELALRPEGTASVCRSYLEHGMDNLPQPVKLYYFADIFRYERPQAGRYRQHHQFGCEAIGEASPMLDAEIIGMALNFFSSLGLVNFSLHLNSIGCKKCRPVHLQKLKEYYAPLQQGLCEDCVTRLEKNPLRLLDCKRPGCQAAADEAPKSADYLCEECGSHFQALKSYLKALDIRYVLNPRLVRGLDYYTKTVFEIQPLEGGSQSALGGGGRYDDLITMLGGKPTPAIGFATGIERIVLNLKSQNVQVPAPQKPALFIACMGEAARTEALKIAAGLRDAGISVIVSSGERSLKAQLRQANTVGAGYTAIIGDDEVKAGTVMLRNMESSEQQETQPEELKDLLDSKQ
ncbi:MAG: histidine--tRNA ligase [Dehalococcoidia bacterium]|nr:MAG: histidine--tRNA ligase [Dehalococcoidia bacterium]